MAKSPTFQPHISTTGTQVIITAPHDVRERTWKTLGYIYDLGVIDKKGGNPTQITVSPFPGYELSAALTLTTTALFLAYANPSLELVWNTKAEDLLVKIIEAIDFCDVNDMSKLDPIWIEIMRQAYIQHIVKQALNQHFDQTFIRSGYREEIVQAWLDEVVEAYRRLHYAPPQTNYIAVGNTDRSYNPEPDIRFFENLVEAAKHINSEIANVKKSCRDYVDMFIYRLDVNGITAVTIEEYLQVHRQISDLGKETYDIHALFPKEDDVQKRLREIRLATPPAPANHDVKK